GPQVGSAGGGRGLQDPSGHDRNPRRLGRRASRVPPRPEARVRPSEDGRGARRHGRRNRVSSPAASLRHASARLDVAPVVGVRSASSLGVSRYCLRLAGALSHLGVDYAPSGRPLSGRPPHVPLANPSRLAAARAGFEDPALLTIHDVLPRTKLLEPVYRRVVYPFLVGTAAATIVHSRFAADLLVRLGGRPR